MELDEFKKRWGTHKGMPEQEHTRYEIDKIIKSNTNSLGELKKKSIFWNRIGGWNSILLVLLAFGYLIWQYYLGMEVLVLAGKLPLVAVLVGFALFSRWTYNRQEEIFSANTDASSREALSKTLSDFRKYYRFTNSVFLVISPVAFYAVFAVFISDSNLSFATICLASAALTGISFLFRYWYYKTVFFRRIRVIESTLRELEHVF